ncbi:UbiH/UbiF/VisC/COQ6 family ubiquinone biosynthesis hydroxylase [Burkholderia glumae]|uniref:UbiH/UbiF/VisC/COQ6 family ubiquinone biosynthesis hydroxylase n=3 Tax=Burkholderia glumae TaxID=337 RepID=A0AAP9XZ81_BURGL|nr:UbiH/UbiF/VisC/COQ6 family ubiquinone biosynthesis hydroxylase [Burkholderia glumae]ACR27778.1 2-octaprenyl-6-methoxyphenol hydroxylase [Burkholderia glumae BGR1]AJY66650.1 ubiquinone biosynthesis hydroxylase, UbiH/UbiF/VisC/COQ6 family protein [Burkholderia glumae LMG 2196 = ATCC 33617]MCM2481243.1 UbiH/UbiF/VisC/COQ6 family ubiquinone biosynthesis hydroxylase [Burkholderia glumae]MCM2508618.1 UbiH/UbiF/VisC/COQ6 family ubiquinone biosynthesis hydroxylase [Burkholderia glumae]MCM2537086.1 
MTTSAPLAPAAAPFDADLAIIGAGPVGLALAGWLARRSATRALSVVLVDAREPSASADDPRAIAVSHGSRLLLEPLGWPADATPIEHIHVSQRGHFGRTLIDRDEHGVAALGYVARYGSLVDALARAVRGTPVRWMTSTQARAPRQDAGGVSVTLAAPDGERELRVRALVNAEGGLFQGGTGDALDGRHRRDYGQTAIVGTVSAAAPRPRTAWERFTPEGPLALLPLGGAGQADYALVWCCAPDEAARRAALPDAAFLSELGAAFGERMGRFTRVVGRASFPLGLVAAPTLVEGRIATVGNAAQTLHPVAGQGLNLGLRDAHTLADALSEHGATPLALAAFNLRRALDRRLTIGATDMLARLFTIDSRPLAALRGAALSALEFVPPLKTAIARQMMFGRRG